MLLLFSHNLHLILCLSFRYPSWAHCTVLKDFTILTRNHVPKHNAIIFGNAHFSRLFLECTSLLHQLLFLGNCLDINHPTTFFIHKMDNAGCPESTVNFRIHTLDTIFTQKKLVLHAAISWFNIRMIFTPSHTCHSSLFFFFRVPKPYWKRKKLLF